MVRWLGVRYFVGVGVSYIMSKANEKTLSGMKCIILGRRKQNKTEKEKGEKTIEQVLCHQNRENKQNIYLEKSNSRKKENKK